jgi:uncharacterized protein
MSMAMEKLSKFVGIRGGVSKRAFDSLMAFRRDVEADFANEVKDVVLFGSRARGQANGDSDYDVAVILNAMDANTATDRRLSNLAYPYLKRGVFIRPVSLSSRQMEQVSGVPLARSIAREGVTLS